MSWQQQLADKPHRPIKRDFTGQHVIFHDVNEIWAADLVDMQKFSKWNKGYKYLLMVIDVYSKYGWIKSLRDKIGETVTEAFRSNFKEGRQPQYLRFGKGKEFYNKQPLIFRQPSSQAGSTQLPKFKMVVADVTFGTFC